MRSTSIFPNDYTFIRMYTIGTIAIVRQISCVLFSDIYIYIEVFFFTGARNYDLGDW
jgi:hypothetical protein